MQILLNCLANFRNKTMPSRLIIDTILLEVENSSEFTIVDTDQIVAQVISSTFINDKESFAYKYVRHGFPTCTLV